MILVVLFTGAGDLTHQPASNILFTAALILFGLWWATEEL